MIGSDIEYPFEVDYLGSITLFRDIYNLSYSPEEAEQRLAFEKLQALSQEDIELYKCYKAQANKEPGTKGYEANAMRASLKKEKDAEKKKAQEAQRAQLLRNQAMLQQEQHKILADQESTVYHSHSITLGYQTQVMQNTTHRTSPHHHKKTKKSCTIM